MPPPAWLDEQPELLSGDEFYIEAFYELSTCRAIGMSVGPIPWRDIINFAEWVELEKGLIPMFVLTIRVMDNVYLKWLDKKRESDKPKPGRKPKGSVKR